MGTIGLLTGSEDVKNCVLALQVEGRENLPAPDQPAVYIANHQSFLVSII